MDQQEQNVQDTLKQRTDHRPERAHWGGHGFQGLQPHGKKKTGVMGPQ
jgi:hypothetical protein